MYLFHIFRSFVPLRNPLGFGVSDLLEWGLAVLACVLIFGHAWMGSWISRFARRTVPCMLALFVLPVGLRLALLPRAPMPVATTPTEFSSLLLSDTLLHGRMANPVHPWHQFFESPLVVQTPTYRSTLPIGEGLLLAVGRALLGSDWAGILLGIGALAALSYWMLRAWVTPGWALSGGVLVACAFGPLCRWTNSYWGGFITALGGCLIVGALPRLQQNRRLRDVVVLSAGIVIELLAYAAVFCVLAPLFVLGCILVLRRLKQFRATLAFVVSLIYAGHFLFWYGIHALADERAMIAVLPNGGRDFLNSADAQIHRAVSKELNREKGKQLVFVRRGPFPVSGEWIHNSADIDGSKVVWARDLGEDKNRLLLNYYRGRKAWLMEPDAIPPRFGTYSAGNRTEENVPKKLLNAAH